MAGSRSITLRCVDCKRVARGSESTRWCDRCGGELQQIKYGPKRRKGARRGR